MTNLPCLPALMFIAALISGCGPGLVIDSASNKYGQAARGIELGDSRDDVRAILDPTQVRLAEKNRKPSEQMYVGNNIVIIDY